MAMQIPVISSPVGILCEVIHHGREGYLVSESQEWIEALSRLVSDHKLRVMMGKSGMAKVENIYDLTKTAAEFLKIIKSIKN